MAHMTRILDILRNGLRFLAVLYLFPLVMGILGLTFLGFVVLLAKLLTGLGPDAVNAGSDTIGAAQ